MKTVVLLNRLQVLFNLQGIAAIVLLPISTHKRKAF
jgi:hypothetical protein